MKTFADTIFYNGRIHSVDASSDVFSAMAVKGGKILEMANTENEKILIDRYYHDGYTRLEDLKQLTVFPGFSDTHIHAPGLAYDILFNINLYSALSKEETLGLIGKFVDEHPEKEIYYGRGVNSGYFDADERTMGPRKEHLDRIHAEKPIVIADFGGNYLWMNSAAFEKFGITAETSPRFEDEIPRDPEDGSLWGIVRGAARGLVPYQLFSDEENARAAKWFQEQMLSYGYTSVLALRPPGTVEPRTTLFPIFKALEMKGELYLRVHGGRDMDPEGDIDDQITEMQAIKSSYDSELIQFTTAKFFLDGVVEGLDACLLQPYAKAAGKGSDYRGAFLWDEDKLAYAFRRCMEAGFQIHCHVIGDGAANKALTAFEKAKRRLPEGDYRNIFTHLQLVSREDIKRMRQNNIIASVQAFWHFKSPALYHQIEKPLLEERAEQEYPLKSLINEGVVVTASSDYPVTPYPNPFYAIKTGVTRNLYRAAEFGVHDISSEDDPVYLLNKEERVSVSDMIKAYTINSAYSRFQEQTIGSLEPGKWADFIVASRDPYETPPMELESIKVIKTYFKGEQVFSL